MKTSTISCGQAATRSRKTVLVGVHKLTLAAAVSASLLYIGAPRAEATVDVAIKDFRGAWSATTTYAAGAVVTYDGASYIALAASEGDTFRKSRRLVHFGCARRNRSNRTGRSEGGDWPCGSNGCDRGHGTGGASGYERGAGCHRGHGTGRASGYKRRAGCHRGCRPDRCNRGHGTCRSARPRRHLRGWIRVLPEYGRAHFKLGRLSGYLGSRDGSAACYRRLLLLRSCICKR
jgi:hypothetical protein